MRPDTNERWIVGPQGTMRLLHDRTLWLGERPVVAGTLTPYLDLEGDESFDNQFREFASALHERRVPLASAEEVRPAVEVLAAAIESAKRNRPIDLGVAKPDRKRR